jgi:hypothetical protein
LAVMDLAACHWILSFVDIGSHVVGVPYYRFIVDHTSEVYAVFLHSCW